MFILDKDRKAMEMAANQIPDLEKLKLAWILFLKNEQGWDAGKPRSFSKIQRLYVKGTDADLSYLFIKRDQYQLTIFESKI